jgi:hypothetical protein
MTKDEIRMTNQKTRGNDETAMAECAPGGSGRFGIGVSSLIRHSGFGFRIFAGLAAAVLIQASGCISLNLKPLLQPGTQTRRDVYVNLMTDDQRSHFYQLEHDEAPPSIKMAYLQEIKIYQQWVEQPKEIQTAILHRQVTETMSPLQVRMAWGPPHEQLDETDPADRAAGHTKLLWNYGPRILSSGETHYDQSVCLLDGRVLWARRNP